jgi:fumarylacetoacetase
MEQTQYLDLVKLIDFELEMGFNTTDANVLGEPIRLMKLKIIFSGMVLMIGVHAIFKMEYVPLGPFLAKKFRIIYLTTSCNDALQPFKMNSQNNLRTTTYFVSS